MNYDRTSIKSLMNSMDRGDEFPKIFHRGPPESYSPECVEGEFSEVRQERFEKHLPFSDSSAIHRPMLS
jgi:hypothetical protein